MLSFLTKGKCIAKYGKCIAKYGKCIAKYGKMITTIIYQSEFHAYANYQVNNFKFNF